MSSAPAAHASNRRSKITASCPLRSIYIVCVPRRQEYLMTAGSAIALLASFAALLARPIAAAETFDIGLATSGARIDAVAVEARDDSARTVVLVGGLWGEDAGAKAVRAAVDAYERS